MAENTNTDTGAHASGKEQAEAEEAETHSENIVRAEAEEEEALLAFRGSEAEGDVQEALMRLRAATLLEDLYEARGRLIESRAEFERGSAEAHRDLAKRSEILMKSVESARRLAALAASAAAPSAQTSQAAKSAHEEAADSIGGKAEPQGSPSSEPPSASGQQAAVHEGMEAAPQCSAETPEAEPKKDALAAAKNLEDTYGKFLESAHASLDAARRELDEKDRAGLELLNRRIHEAEEKIAREAKALLDKHAPSVRLEVQPVGRENAVAWIDRPTGDDAVLLCLLLTGHLPTHYDALFDDGVDDPTLEAPIYFPEADFPARPRTPDEADELSGTEAALSRMASLMAGGGLWEGDDIPANLFVPYKAHIPFRLPGLPFPRFRLANQGPVTQILARAQGSDYSPLMPMAWAELASGLFIQLKMLGKIELEMKA